MAKVKIPVAGTIGKTISFDPDATVGATIGEDLKLPDGTTPSLAELIKLFATTAVAELTKFLADTLYLPVYRLSALEIAAGLTNDDVIKSIPWGWVTRYGGIGDDSIDNTTAFQNAILATQSSDTSTVKTGGRIYMPAGIYRVAGPLTNTEAIYVYGDGRRRTLIRKTTTTGNLFTITTDEPCVFRDFSITTSGTPTAGAYFSVDGGSASTLNKFSRFYNLRLGTFYDGISFLDAKGFRIRDCRFVDGFHVGIDVSRSGSLEPDNGDSMIYGCGFDTSKTANTTYAIRQFASGGLRVIGNKFLRHDFQYSGQHGVNDGTSVLLLNSNSFENPIVTNIAISENGGGSMAKVVITGNQITANGTSYGMNIQDIRGLTIGSNEMQLGSSATAAIFLQDVTAFMIAPNNIDGNSSGVGISLNAGCLDGEVAVQNFKALTTNISNSATSATVQVARRMLTGTATWNPADMADGASEETDITVTGAGLNDPAIVNFPGLGSIAVQVGGQVRAADTVHATMTNHNGGNVNPSSSTVTAVVFAKQ